MRMHAHVACRTRPHPRRGRSNAGLPHRSAPPPPELEARHARCEVRRVLGLAQEVRANGQGLARFLPEALRGARTSGRARPAPPPARRALHRGARTEREAASQAGTDLRKLDVRLRFGPGDERTFGQLGEQDHRVYFEYSDAFLASGLELSPVHLKARKGLIEHTQLELGPLPGLFDDSLPDGWGLLLMDRYFRKKRVDLDALSPLDLLQF